MPEGPQVHLIAQIHDQLFAGKKLQLESPDGRSAEIADAFHARKLRRVDAVGKHLLYVFNHDHILHIHLGRFGKFRSGELPTPEVTDALRFRMHSTTHWAELRGAVAIEHYDTAHRNLLEARIGPDPLNGDDPTPAFAVIAAKRTAIGALLMDQAIIGGIGNIFRAEMLFRAGVSPHRPGNACDTTLLRALWDDVHILMQYSMTHAGRIVTTDPAHRGYPKRKNVVRSDAFYVYGRAGKPCRRCGTTVESVAMAGRTVFFCRHCQPE